MNRDLLGKPTFGSAVARQVPGRAEQRLLPPGTSLSCTPVPTHLSRNSHVTVALDGTSSARHLLQQHAGPYESSLLRRQLNKSSIGTAVTPVAAPAKAQPFLPGRSLLAQHLTQRNNEPKGVELAPSEKVRILKTSGGTVTVRSLSPVVATSNSRVQTEQPRAAYGSVLTELSRTVHSVDHQSFPGAIIQKRMPSSPVAGAPNIPRKILPKPVHSMSFLANGARSLQGAAAVSTQGGASRMKYTEVCAHATSSDVITGLKNMAVVHPQVRSAMSSKPVTADELAKDAQLSKAAIQNMAVSVAQKLVRAANPNATASAAASVRQSLPEPNQVVPVSIQRSIPMTVTQRMDEEENRRSRMFFVELAEAAEMAALAKQSAPAVSMPSETRVPTPPAANEEPLPIEAGCLQVPSGLKVDFINLDDLLIGDLNYLAKYFGLSILEPLSMDDIANKGLSEWIDISDEAEVEKTFVELKELNGSPGQQLCWANRLTPDSPDIAYPIVVPEYEELETTGLSTDSTKPTVTAEAAEGKSSSSSSSSSPVTVNHSSRSGRECNATKSPLILIIKKGANSSASSPAWQLSPCRQSASKDSEESKAIFFAALNLLPSAGEQLRKLRKGKSARALAVLKDKVMSEYLKNHYVPLHRVQGMYRYLFKKGHLREGKLTYACEVYRNLRSRENRPRASLVISRYDDEDFVPKKNQTTSPGLLWHLKKKKASSKYEIDEDYVPRKSQTNGQKIRRSLWGRPKASWRAAAATQTRSSRSSSSSSASVETSAARQAEAGGYDPTPLYTLEAGNWTPKCAADEDSGRWDIWVSENSLESKMSRPIPMVVLTRIEDCHTEASSDVEPPQCTQVSELFCNQCSYSCLNKPSLVNHFSLKHEGTDVSFKTVVISCRGNKTALSPKRQDSST